MRQFLVTVAVALLVFSGPAYMQGQKTLDIYSIDAEGGKATLVVSPSGESLLIDAGSAGGRDPGRILATAKEAGLTRIDHLIVTHYDGDHVGGVKEVSDGIPIRHFIDYGPRVTPPAGAPEPTPQQQANMARMDGAYAEARARGTHTVAKVGDMVPIKGLDVQVVSSRGQLITKPLAGGGEANPLCSAYVPHPPDTTDNLNSVGVVIGAFGRFRLLDLADLPWNAEHDLVCPRNLLGTVDVYLTTHHGLARSNLPALVGAVAPRVALMNNGIRKGGSVETWDALRKTKSIEDVWQLHYSVKRPISPQFEEKVDPGGPDFNAPEQFTANLGEEPAHSPAYNLKVSVRPDGSFVVTNTRNGFNKEYKPRAKR